MDGTGAQWCYVDSSSSICQDLVLSERFPHNPLSYQACATPHLGSHLCPVIGADYVHPQPVVPSHVQTQVVVPTIVSAPPSHIHPGQRLNTQTSNAAELVAPEK